MNETTEVYELGIKEVLIGLPLKIKEQSKKVWLTNEDIEQTIQVLEHIKNKHMQEVVYATNEQGNPKFSNDKMRNIATDALISNDIEYKSNGLKLKELQTRLVDEKIQLDYLINLFSMTKILIALN